MKAIISPERSDSRMPSTSRYQAMVFGMSVANTSTWASRRGCTRGALLRFGAFCWRGLPPNGSTGDFSFGELFSATRISINIPDGSRSQMPFDSKPLGGSSRSSRICSMRAWNFGMSSS